jgi:hypothetical protein
MLKPMLCVVALMLLSGLTCVVIDSLRPSAESVTRSCNRCHLQQHANPAAGVWVCHRCGRFHLATEGASGDAPSP